MIDNDGVASFRAAMATKGRGRRNAVAAALVDLLERSGLTREEAAQALAVFGHRGEHLQLIDLYQGALLRERMAGAMGEADSSGKLKRGVLTRIHATYAEIWAEHTGDPGYGPEQFKAAYNKWKRATGGGGFGLAERTGRELKPRAAIDPPKKRMGN